MDMPSTEVPTMDTTSPSLIIQPQTSIEQPLHGRSLTPPHLVFPGAPHATDIHLGDVYSRSASPSSAPPTDPPPLSTAIPSDEDIQKYFDTKVPHERTKHASKRTSKCTSKRTSKRDDKINNLTRAARGFWKATVPQTFEDEDTTFLQNIRIVHYVRLIEKFVDKSSKGVGPRTAALEQTATDLSLDRSQVRILNQEGKRYVELILLPDGGPGLLLLLGPHIKGV